MWGKFATMLEQGVMTPFCKHPSNLSSRLSRRRSKANKSQKKDTNQIVLLHATVLAAVDRLAIVTANAAKKAVAKKQAAARKLDGIDSTKEGIKRKLPLLPDSPPPPTHMPQLQQKRLLNNYVCEVLSTYSEMNEAAKEIIDLLNQKLASRRIVLSGRFVA
jgi:hypothetical protein